MLYFSITNVLFLSKIKPDRNYENITSLYSCANYIKSYLLPFADVVYFQEYEFEGKTYKNVIAFYGLENSKRLIIGNTTTTTTRKNPTR